MLLLYLVLGSIVLIPSEIHVMSILIFTHTTKCLCTPVFPYLGMHLHNSQIISIAWQLADNFTRKPVNT
jgi:hypothetical protein